VIEKGIRGHFGECFSAYSSNRPSCRFLSFSGQLYMSMTVWLRDELFISFFITIIGEPYATAIKYAIK
jgi:hypothetical protein